MFEFHREQRAEMTVGVRHYEFNVPYGVVNTEAGLVTHIAEKPTQRMFVNAGIYLCEPEACALVPQDRHFDMTDLIARLISEKRRVVAFPICEYWVDIGRPEDYEEARARAAATPGTSR
jgi:NDP-sugar pyrophosphorylase family protein